jgi:RNA-directed DNA polymerase
VAQRYLDKFAGQPRPARKTVVDFLLQDQSFQRAWARRSSELKVAEWLTGVSGMHPVPAASDWAIPPIDSVGELARWLRLRPGELQWFADLKTIGARARIPALQQYHYRVLQKASGSLRLIEAPKARLKQIQRKILAEILEPIPSHPAVHGFLKGHSIRTYAAEHVGRRVVLRMDVRNFFPSIGRARIQALFRTAGYPELVANLLGGICTSATPRRVWNEAALRAHPRVDPTELHELRALYARPHLPQGAPTSPALANLCAYRVDCRLRGLAESAGARYTRYADDLAFSGDHEFDRRVERFATHVAVIVHEEGFAVHHRKTRIMRQGVRQYLAGVVTNQHLNVVRADFDRLKATLTNCIRHGPESQNRESHPQFRMHLEGRVSFVESINPARGERLRKLFKQIEW